ncbi:MAG TPA: flagellar biosynthesis protein FlhF, partial [Achromobacter sp.]
MKISRFFGANSRDVMRQVRQVLGPDALIVSNRSVDGGVEVLATVEGAFDEAAQEAPPRQDLAQSRPAEFRPQTPAGIPTSVRFDAPDTAARPSVSAPVMPPVGYPAPSRSIAAYHAAYAASTQAEDETPQVAPQTAAPASAAPVRVELPSLPPLRQAPADAAPA